MPMKKTSQEQMLSEKVIIIIITNIVHWGRLMRELKSYKKYGKTFKIETVVKDERVVTGYQN
jgi:hypothetical protein